MYNDLLCTFDENQNYRSGSLFVRCSMFLSTFWMDGGAKYAVLLMTYAMAFAVCVFYFIAKCMANHRTDARVRRVQMTWNAGNPSSSPSPTEN